MSTKDVIFSQCQKDWADYSESLIHKVFSESIFQATISAHSLWTLFPKLEFRACAAWQPACLAAVLTQRHSFKTGTALERHYWGKGWVYHFGISPFICFLYVFQYFLVSLPMEGDDRGGKNSTHFSVRILSFHALTEIAKKSSFPQAETLLSPK